MKRMVRTGAQRVTELGERRRRYRQYVAGLCGRRRGDGETATFQQPVSLILLYCAAFGLSASERRR